MPLQLADLDGKMKELDEERAELARYQEADKERRGIEYAIYDRELTAVKKQLEEVCLIIFFPNYLHNAAHVHHQQLTKQQEAADAAAARVQEEADAARTRLHEVEEEAASVRAMLPDLRAQHGASALLP